VLRRAGELGGIEEDARAAEVVDGAHVAELLHGFQAELVGIPGFGARRVLGGQHGLRLRFDRHCLFLRVTLAQRGDGGEVSRKLHRNHRHMNGKFICASC
jgi:hypothetical protein